MTSYVRKNLLIFRATYVDEAGVAVTPTGAFLVLEYTGVDGTPKTQTMALLNQGGVWTGQWDSSLAKSGRVEWMTYCTGVIQAATQGFFQIVANKANVG